MTEPAAPPPGPSWQPPAPPSHPVLVINPASGDGKAARFDLADKASRLGIQTIILRTGQDISEVLDSALADGADALGMAGGDGSLAPVAAAAVAHDVPFVCVPAGTRNHFAQDLGEARDDPAGALAAFADGVERLVDVAEVNGRVFLNNVSVGIYADALQLPGYRDAKLRSLLATAKNVLGPSATTSTLSVVDDLGHPHTHPAVLLVSNNPYIADQSLVNGTRPRLDSGQLGVVVLDRPGRPRHSPARAWTATSLQVDSTAPVNAGVDGEAATLTPPLRFSVRPSALRVRIPQHP